MSVLEWWRGGSVEYLVAGLIPQSCNFFGFWMALTEMDVLMCPFFCFWVVLTETYVLRCPGHLPP